MALADALVVGGGVMGCGIGLRLAQAGVRVTVLERSIPGAEASSAAAGILGPQLEAEGPGPFLELCLRSRGMYRAFAQELLELSGIDVAYLPCGAFRAGMDEADVHRIEAAIAWQKALGLRAELLSGEEVRNLEPALAPGILAAAHFPDDHQVDNRLLVRALSMAAARAGVQFRTGYVRALLCEGDRCNGVDLDGGEERAGAVVVAAGSWTGLLAGVGLDPQTVRPARGQMVELSARLPPFSHVVAGDQGYLVPRRDGRVIAGSTMELVGFEKQVTAQGLAGILSLAVRLCPSLAGAPVQQTWAGLRPYTEDHLPILGAAPMRGLFLATGHFRNGILLTPITARLIAELLLGKTPAVDLHPFRLERFRPR
jgi:glycine oxidase